jgi:peptide/nickel transport system ATP-binding protein
MSTVISGAPPAGGAVLQVNDLKKHFPIRGGLFSGPTAFVYAVLRDREG